MGSGSHEFQSNGATASPALPRTLHHSLCNFRFMEVGLILHATSHTSHVTRHTSHVTRHTSHVTRHTSHVTRHTSHVTRNTSPRLGGAARVKVDWGRLWMTRIDNHSGGNETGSRSAPHDTRSKAGALNALRRTRQQQ
jgi:hypothetical protein